MPLDPQAELFLSAVESANPPPLYEQTPEEGRAAMRMLASFAGAPVVVAETEDRSIPGPAGDIPVRVYCPAASGALPAVVYFHGGGFVIGGIDTTTCGATTWRSPCRRWW